MFSLSDKSLNHLSYAIYALREGGWFESLQQYALADNAEWIEMKELGSYYPGGDDDFFSIKNLRAHLHRTEPVGSENLRALCNDLLRNKEKYQSEAVDNRRFSDSLAEFEVQLERDGFVFDGFVIVSAAHGPSLGDVVERSRESFRGALGQLPGIEEAAKYLERAEGHLRELSDANKAECLTNLRLFFKHALEAVAREQERRTGQPLSSRRENEVREYLKKVGFFTEEEWKGFNGIYGLLSMGPHGHGSTDTVRLGYATSLAAFSYLLSKL